MSATTAVYASNERFFNTYMKKIATAFAYLSFFTSEVLLYLIGSFYLGRYLNKSILITVDWMLITMPIALLLCLWSLVKFFGRITKV
jgi:hypothetical protein